MPGKPSLCLLAEAESDGALSVQLQQHVGTYRDVRLNHNCECVTNGCDSMMEAPSF